MKKGNSSYDKQKVMEEAAKIFMNSKKEIIKELADLRGDMVVNEMERTVKLIGIDAFVEGKFIPYATAAVILVFSGRDPSKNNISKLLKSMDIKVDKELLKVIDKLGYKNHLIYLNAIYFILELGRDPTEESVSKVVKAMGIKPEPVAIKGAMEMYQKKISQKWGTTSLN